VLRNLLSLRFKAIGVRKTLNAGDRAELSEFFDAAFYLETNPEVARGGADPLAHYFDTGWREGRDPAPWFSTNYYLAANPDVAFSGANPFRHYLKWGRMEGRWPKGAPDHRRFLLAPSPPQYKTPNRILLAEGELLGKHDVCERLLSAARNAEGAVLSFSHGSYTAVTAGIEVFLGDEQRAFNERGWLYLHFSPLEFMRFIADEAIEDSFLRLTLDGQVIGAAAASVILEALAGSGLNKLPRRVLAMHCALGQPYAAFEVLLRSFDPQESYYWVHDFSSVCPGINLLRNGVEYCHAPPEDSTACAICVYGAARSRNTALLERMFERADFTVVAPSAAALNLWRRASRLSCRDLVAKPHCALDYSCGEFRRARPASEVGSSRAVRAAFAGPPSTHKGGHIFQALVEKAASDKAYAFFHFSNLSGGFGSPRVRRVHAEVSAKRRQAMVELLKEHEIDIVVVPSIWPETFSYVAYEALAAGCDIATLAASGNVAALVNGTGRGRVFADEAGLIDFFESHAAVELARLRAAKPNPCGSLALCGTTAALVFGGASESRARAASGEAAAP